VPELSVKPLRLLVNDEELRPALPRWPAGNSVSLTRGKTGPSQDASPLGKTQPQRRLKSASGWHSVGLGSFRFLSYCIHMGVCLVFARFLSITFQRLALRQGDFRLALNLSNRRVR
jgi:hypothetical protein